MKSGYDERMFNRSNLITGLVFIVVIGLVLFPDSFSNSSFSSPALSSSASSSLVVENVKIYDLDGRLAYQGNVDLSPDLARILAGERDPHDNDGGIFSNREGLLPQKERGYYREYVVRTPTISHAGPQRLVIGEGDELYYTPDHYASFVRLN